MSPENVTIMTSAASRALSAARRTCRLDRANIRRMPLASTGVTGSSASILAGRRNRDVEVEARGLAGNDTDGPRHRPYPLVPAKPRVLAQGKGLDFVSAPLRPPRQEMVGPPPPPRRPCPRD